MWSIQLRSLGGDMARLVRTSQGPVLAALTAVWLVVCSAANAMADSVQFDIAAQAMPQALKRFAAQAHVQLLFDYKAVEALKTPAVRGRLEAADALGILLRGTGLTFEQVNDHTIAIQAAKPTSDAQQAPGSPSDQEGKTTSSGDFRLAQATAGQTSSDASVAAREQKSADEEALQEVHPNTPEILIKGSRIMNVDVKRTEDDVQPYTIFDSTQIKQSGATTVEDFLKQQLTMDTTAQTNSQAFASTSGTTSSINLRGLGTNETLILIDGRRVAGVNIATTNLGASNQPDINGIPMSAIERIEVLPSSASAIYGGAAVGGVVNIILKRQFDGGDVGYTYDNPASGHAPIRTVSANYGMTFGGGRTQVLLAGSYSDGDPLFLSDRVNLIDRGISTVLSNSPSSLYNPSAPFQGATPNIGSVATFNFANYPACSLGPSGIQGCLSSPNLTLRNGTPLNSPITSIPAGTAPGSNLSAGLLANAGKYNLNLSPGNGFLGLQSNFGSVPLTKSLLATVRQTIFEDVQLFTEFSTSSNSSRTSYNPFSTPVTVPSTAPTNPFQQSVVVAFPSTVASPDTSDSVTQTVTVGALVPLAYGWRAEFDYTWSRNLFETAFDGVDDVALSSALSAGTVNPFVDTIAHPLTLTPYSTQNLYSGSATLNDSGLRASGPIGSLPAGQPTLTVGLEHRKEGTGTADNILDDPATPASSFQVQYFGQSQSTDSVYAEALIPLVAARNAGPGVDSLDFQLAGRSERYTVFTGTLFEYLSPPADQAFNPPQGVHTTTQYTSTNPTVGLKYQPVTDVSLRASYSTAFLPPTASQLFANPTPCPLCGPVTDPRTGATYFVNTTSGGNPGLKPQTSRNWDFGLIWEPQEEFLRGLRTDVEYYKITQPNYITIPAIETVVTDPAFASRVTRDPSTGLITSVDLSPVNAEEYKTSGWDLKADYRKPTTAGTFGVRVAGTYIKYDLRQYTIGSPFLEYAGFPNEGGEGKFKANGTLNWEYRRWNLAWSTTYYASYYQLYSPGSPSYIQFGPSPSTTNAQGGYSIPSQIYHDIYGSYTFAGGAQSATGRVLSNLSIQFGVANVFNSAPPFDYHYFPWNYSPYGSPRLRDFRIGFKKGF